MDPQLLFRSAEAHDQHIRPRGGYAIEDGSVLSVVFFETQRRTVRAHNLDRGPAAADICRGPLRYARRSPQQVRPQRLIGAGCLKQSWNQVGAGNPLRQCAAEQARRPEDGSAIDENHARVAIRGPTANMILQHHDVIDVRSDNKSTAALWIGDPGQYLSDRLIHSQRVDLDAEKLNSG